MKQTKEKLSKVLGFQGSGAHLSPATGFARGLWPLGGRRGPLPRSLWARAPIVCSFHGTDGTRCPGIKRMGELEAQDLISRSHIYSRWKNQWTWDSWAICWACGKRRQSRCLSRGANFPGLHGPASLGTQTPQTRKSLSPGRPEWLVTLHPV